MFDWMPGYGSSYCDCCQCCVLDCLFDIVEVLYHQNSEYDRIINERQRCS